MGSGRYLVNERIELEIVPGRPRPRGLSIEDDVLVLQMGGAFARETAVSITG